jgi:hypothetical protein
MRASRFSLPRHKLRRGLEIGVLHAVFAYATHLCAEQNLIVWVAPTGRMGIEDRLEFWPMDSGQRRN